MTGAAAAIFDGAGRPLLIKDNDDRRRHLAGARDVERRGLERIN